MRSSAMRATRLTAGAMLAMLSPGVAAAQATGGGAPTLPIWWYLAPLGAVLALVMAYRFYQTVTDHSEGDDEMVRIAKAVREGAYAYLSSQARVVYIVVAVLLVVLLLLGFGGLQSKLTWLGFTAAAILSGGCGFFGMKTATNASARTAHAAKSSLNEGLRIAFRAGAVMGLCVTGFAVLDVSIWFFILSQFFHDALGGLPGITTVMLSFAMGASLQALFARVGGGIYTKAADVGADLIGKVEAGIPEDDARNPATIADNVGDNVGDVAGMGADLYESYYGSILAATALAAAAAFQIGLGMSEAIRLVAAPLSLAGLGIIASVACIFLVRTREGASMSELLKSLHMAVWASSAIIVVLGGLLLYLLLGPVEGVSWLGVWGAILVGLGAGLVIAWGTEYYTSYEHAPTQRISKQAQTGPATVIIAGVAEGMISTWIPLLTVVVAILLAFTFAGGNEQFLLGVFGVGIAAVGMLSTLAITLATDAYGPIADNAGGNAEMTHQDPKVRERTDMLDSLGNTTAATGKGFAIGSAALTALALLSAYVITVQSSLTTQARAAAADTEVVEQAEQGVANAFDYESNGQFLVAVPDMDGGGVRVDAGLLLDRHKQRKIEAGLAAGREVDRNYDAGGGVFQCSIPPEGGGQGVRFSVVPASTATLPQLMSYYDVTITNPRVLCGLFVGVMLVFVFCAMTMNAVGRAAYEMMGECRRQFDKMKQAFKKQGLSDEQINEPTQWPYEVTTEDGKRYPDYASCVTISTRGALKEMVTPSLMAVIVPIALGLVLGVPGVMGMLSGALVSGFAVAILMANSGGAWDNAKKYIETGQYGGKGSEAHKAGVVGDTVGDPFKDTSGPALNILIKLISVVSVVFAGLIVQYAPHISAALGL